GAGETAAHLKKFGKLLATFGTRMACLLRHLGPECPPQDRAEAYRLYAKARDYDSGAAASAYPGLLASRRAQDGAGARGGSSVTASGSVAATAGVAGGIIYPKAVESFLSTTDRPPCCPSAGAGAARPVATAARTGANDGVAVSGEPAGDVTDNVLAAEEAGTAGAAAATAARIAERRGAASTRRSDAEPPVSCRCYEGAAAGPFSGRRHDPWEALEALRPPGRGPSPRTPSPPPPPTPSSRTGDLTNETLDNCGRINPDPGGGGKSPAVDPLGAVLLLCEVLSRGYGRWISPAAPEAPMILRRREGCCCAWLLDHLAALFPGSVEVAPATDVAPSVAACAFAAPGSVLGREAASDLCNTVAVALGLFVSRRALDGENQEAQVQLIEGCACHPHPLCREAWVGALKVFLRKCDSAAQESFVQSLTDAALDPRVSSRRRRRLARALTAVCAAGGAGNIAAGGSGPRLVTAAPAVLIKSCLSRLRQGHGQEVGYGRGSGSSRADGGSDRSGRGGACALDLLRSLLPWCASSGGGGAGAGDEITAASVSFAEMAATACLGDPAATSRGGGFVSTGSTDESQQTEENFAAAARFLARRSKPAVARGSRARTFGGGAGESASGGGQNRSLVAVEEGAREAGAKLGGLLAAGRLPGGLSGRTLSAIMGLVERTDAGRLPQLCALIAKEAHAGTDGEALLALAEGLSSVGRRQVTEERAR
ncbi:unnamed protein product, partial [Hapterophycus canaliculatus]